MVLRMMKVSSRCGAEDARSGEIKKEVIIFFSSVTDKLFVWNQ